MDYSIIKEMFDDDGWIKYNKKIAKVYGSSAAILFGYLVSQDIYWGKMTEEFEKQTGYPYAGEFFQSREQIEEQTSLTPHEQRTAEKALMSDKKMLLVNVISKPIKLPYMIGRINYYSLNQKGIIKFFEGGSLKNCTRGRQKSEREVVKKVHSNKTISNKTISNKSSSTTTFEGADRTTSRKGGMDLEALEVLEAYKQHVDAEYALVPADVTALNLFEYKHQLVDIMWLWPYFTGDKSFGDDYELAECKGHLTKYEKKHTGNIWVITQKWNAFRKWAKNKQESLARKEANRLAMEANK